MKAAPLIRIVMEEKYRASVAGNPLLAPVLTVRPEYLNAAFEEIARNYGGVDNYLRNCLDTE